MKTTVGMLRSSASKHPLHLSHVTTISLIGPIEAQSLIGAICRQGKHLNLLNYLIDYNNAENCPLRAGQ